MAGRDEPRERDEQRPEWLDDAATHSEGGCCRFCFGSLQVVVVVVVVVVVGVVVVVVVVVVKESGGSLFVEFVFQS